MALSKRGKELRRCQAFTLNGYGSRCRHWAEGFSDYCNLHNGKIRHYPDQEEQALRRLFPKLHKKSKKHRLCSCSSYPFPHGFGAGLCRWPEPPTHQLITDKADKEETKLKKKLRKMGLQINCIKKRTGEVRKIERNKPEDLTLEENYLAEKAANVERLRVLNRYDDFSTLPIEQKRRIWKDQILAEFYRQNPHLDKRGYPHTVEVNGKILRYKIAKDRNGKTWIILETGQKIALSDEA